MDITTHNQNRTSVFWICVTHSTVFCKGLPVYPHYWTRNFEKVCWRALENYQILNSCFGNTGSQTRKLLCGLFQASRGINSGHICILQEDQICLCTETARQYREAVWVLLVCWKTPSVRTLSPPNNVPQWYGQYFCSGINDKVTDLQYGQNTVQ